MKKTILVCLLILALLLGGCATEGGVVSGTEEKPTVPTLASPAVPEGSDTDEELPASSTEAAEPASTEPLRTEPEHWDPEDGELSAYFDENPAFTAIAGPNCDPSILAVLYNDPFADGEPKPTVVWNEGEFDRLVICPRWIGSMIDVWQIERSLEDGEETERLEGPVYTAVCESGDSYGAALERPDAAAKWAVSVTVPEFGNAYLELNYNGRYGTPAYEYLTDNSAAINAAAQTMDPAYAEIAANELGEDFFYAFLRAAFRSGKDLWAAIEQYCSPIGDYGDGAAYTQCECEMEGDTCRMDAAQLREGYDPGSDGSVADRAEAQAQRYAEIGNAEGILGIDPERNEALYFDLKGITVYNPTLLAQEVQITVNGEDAGTFSLTEGDFVTLLDLGLEKLPADTAIRVEARVTRSRGPAEAAILELWPGLGGNISGSR